MNVACPICKAPLDLDEVVCPTCGTNRPPQGWQTAAEETKQIGALNDHSEMPTRIDTPAFDGDPTAMISAMTDDDARPSNASAAPTIDEAYMKQVSGSQAPVSVDEYYSPQQQKQIHHAERQVQRQASKKSGSGFKIFLVLVVLLAGGAAAAWFLVPEARTWAEKQLGLTSGEQKPSAEESAPAPAPAAEAETVDLAALIHKAEQAVDTHEFKTAIAFYEQVLAEDPNYEKAKVGLPIARQKLATYAPKGKILIGGNGVDIHITVDSESYQLEKERAPKEKPLFTSRFSNNEEITTMDQLKQKIRQIILIDVYGRKAKDTVRTMVREGKSAHFLIDDEGTAYQLLDLTKSAPHAGSADDVAIVIALQQKEPPRTVKKNDDSITQKSINGEEVAGYSYADAQYTTLIELVDKLMAYSPLIKAQIPRDPESHPIMHALESSVNYRGILGEYHVDLTQRDPGPGFDWDRLEKALADRYPQRTK